MYGQVKVSGSERAMLHLHICSIQKRIITCHCHSLLQCRSLTPGDSPMPSFGMRSGGVYTAPTQEMPRFCFEICDSDVKPEAAMS